MSQPVLQPGAAGGRVQGGVGSLEASLSSQARSGDGLTPHLLLHLPPLLASQEEVHVLGGHVLADGVLLDTEIYGNLKKEKTPLSPEGGGWAHLLLTVLSSFLSSVISLILLDVSELMSLAAAAADLEQVLAHCCSSATFLTGCSPEIALFSR